MAMHQERVNRLRRWKAAFGRFIPLNISAFQAFRTSLAGVVASMVASLFAPQKQSRVALNRSGMLGFGRNTRSGRNRRAKQRSKAASSNSYETLEPRQLLAADFMVSLDTTDPANSVLTIVGDSGDNEITVDVSSGEVSIDVGSGTFTLADSTMGLGLESDGANLTLGLDTDSTTAISVDGAGGNDTLTAIGTGSIDLTFIGGDGDDIFSLQDGGVLTALNPDDSANLLSRDRLEAGGLGNRVDGAFDGASGSTIFVDGTVELEPIEPVEPILPLGGNLTLGGGENFATAGTIYIGDQYELTLDDDNEASLGSLTTVTDDGTLTADQGINLSGGDVLTGAGAVDIGTDTNDLNLDSGTVQGSLTITGDVDVDSGTLTGTTIVNGDVDLGTGLVAGNITVNGALSGPSVDDNAGTVSPGFSPGIVTAGSFVLTSADTLEIDIDGTAGAGAVGGHDQVVATDSVDISGAS